MLLIFYSSLDKIDRQKRIVNRLRISPLKTSKKMSKDTDIKSQTSDAVKKQKLVLEKRQDNSRHSRLEDQISVSTPTNNFLQKETDEERNGFHIKLTKASSNPHKSSNRYLFITYFP